MKELDASQRRELVRTLKVGDEVIVARQFSAPGQSCRVVGRVIALRLPSLVRVEVGRSRIVFHGTGVERAGLASGGRRVIAGRGD
jgi:hypothetical protein